MNLEELRECRIEFGKAHLNKSFEKMLGEKKYMAWFAENYRHSQKICHMKFLRFIELHLDHVEGQMNQAHSKAKAKAKAHSQAIPCVRDRPDVPHDPRHPSSDEEEIEGSPWEPVMPQQGDEPHEPAHGGDGVHVAADPDASEQQCHATSQRLMNRHQIADLCGVWQTLAEPSQVFDPMSERSTREHVLFTREENWVAQEM